MSNEPRYKLADSTVIEPLVNQWSAWPQLLSPVPAALHLANYQLPALASYLKDPLSHVAASRDPEMIGGPFVDLPPERAAEVERLLESTKGRLGAHVELARTVTEFHNWLVDEAKGQCLEHFYERIPEVLRGYVELVYDYYNRPTVRFFESLLYGSEYYRPELQSLRLWPLRRDATRAFFMSTPRLLEGDQIDWQVPFGDPRVDELFRLDLAPRPLSYIRELLGTSPAEDGRLLPLLSRAPAETHETWGGREARIRYVGHACVLVEWNGVSILTDPYVGARPTEGGPERFSYDDLPAKIDFALVTHSHQDHYALETLLRLRHRIEHLVVPKSSGLLYGDMSLKLMSRKAGFKSVVELEPLEEIEMPGGSIIGVPFLGEHGDLAHSKSGYVVRLGPQQILFGADSDCLDGQIYVNIRKALGPIETVFLGTECVGAPLYWGCGPLFPKKQERQIEESRRYHGSDSNAGLKILELVGARRIYNYAMGMEPWVEHLLGLGLTENDPQYIESERLVRRARGRGMLAAERLYGKGDLRLPASPAVTGASKDETPPTAADEQRERYEQLLEGYVPVFERAEDELREQGEAAQSESRPLEMSAALVEGLKGLSGGLQEPHSLRTALLAAFLTTLRYYTSRDEFVLGLLADERALLLRVDLSGDPSFVNLTARVREVIDRAAEWQSGPVGQTEIAFSASSFKGQTPACDLGLFVDEAGDSLVGELRYDPRLFKAADAADIVGHFREVARVVVEGPGRRLEEVLTRASESAGAAARGGASHAFQTEDQFAF
jgi:L-ascorbate metabolism protein UlaG (beta-lactamase superfamily)